MKAVLLSAALLAYFTMPVSAQPMAPTLPPSWQPAALAPPPSGQLMPPEAPPSDPAGTLHQSVLGPWEFGRARGISSAPAGLLCRFVLTNEPSRFGWQIGQSCNGNETYWQLDHNRIIVRNRYGEPTTIFTQIGPNSWQGAFLPDRRVIHYLRRY